MSTWFRDIRFDLFLVLVTCLTILKVTAYPNPQLESDQHLCNITANVERICDPAGLFSNGDYAHLMSILQSPLYDCNISCESCEGNKNTIVGLATISNSTLDDEADLSLADEIRIQWNLSSCENDILVLFSADTNKVHLSLGASALFHLPSVCVSEIEDAVNSILADKRYLDAFNETIHMLQILYYPGVKIRPECSILHDSMQTQMVPSADSTDGPPPPVLQAYVIALIVISIVLVLVGIGVAVYCILKSHKRTYLNYHPNADELNHARSAFPHQQRLGSITVDQAIMHDFDLGSGGHSNPSYASHF